MQMTRLTCGGYIFAVRLNHTISDSLGLVQFLNTAAEMASGSRVPLKQPVWQRQILNARDPPRITCIHHEFEVVNKNKSTTIIENNNMDHWSLFFGPKEMRSIRKHLPPHLQIYLPLRYSLLVYGNAARSRLSLIPMMLFVYHA